MILTIFCQLSYVPYFSSYDVFRWNLFSEKGASSRMYNCIILHDTTQMWPTLGGLPRPVQQEKKQRKKEEILTHDLGLTPQSVQVHGLDFEQE